MKLNTIIYSIFVMAILSSCGVPQEDFDKLQNEKKELIKENERLLTELDDCKNGAEKIVAEVEKAYSKKICNCSSKD
jgi:predicted nuclease with TOPRIM domain